MRISSAQLDQFVDFLRTSCKVRQFISYHPSPNPQGEYFRALSEGHLLIGYLHEPDQLCITTDDAYQVELYHRWAEHSKTELKPESILKSLKSLLLNGRRPAPTPPPANAILADSLAMTMDLPRK